MNKAERESTILKMKRENPELSLREIANRTKIKPTTVWRTLKNQSKFKTEEELVSFIEDNSEDVFDEKIKWIRSQTILGADKGSLRPDLTGIDSKGNLFIVEVKLSKPDRSVVSQILDYASYLTTTANSEDALSTMGQAFREFIADDKQDLRLFIIGEEVSETVERICEFLQARGINISHFALTA